MPIPKARKSILICGCWIPAPVPAPLGRVRVACIGSRPRWRRRQEDNDAVHGVNRSMSHQDIAGEPVGRASRYGVERRDAVCPQGVIPTWRQCALRWIKWSVRQLHSDQSIMPWPTFQATQNTSSQFTLPRFLFQFCRCQTPDRRFRQTAIAGGRPAGDCRRAGPPKCQHRQPRLFLASPTPRLRLHNKETGNAPEIEEATQRRTGGPPAECKG